MDFSKPDKFIREITEFLNSVTLVTDIQTKPKGRTMSSNDAQLLLLHLMQLVVPNIKRMPNFQPKEV